MFSLYLGTYQHSVDVSSVLLLLLLLQTSEAAGSPMAKQSQHMLSVSALGVERVLKVSRRVGLPCLLGSWVIADSSIWAEPFRIKPALLESLVPGLVRRASHAGPQVLRLFKSLQQPFDVVTTITTLCRAVN